MNHNFIFIGKKQFEYYSSLLIRADMGLHDQIAHTLLQKVKRGASVLDMGAGQGALSALLYDLGYIVTAVDINHDDFLSNKRDLIFEKVNFNDECELATFINNNKSSFDAVCSVEVIEHLENPWSYVRSLVTLVRPGGLVLITTPNITSWLSRWLFLRKGLFLCFQDHNLSYGHINPISTFELKLIMTKCGLHKIDIESGGTLPPLYFSSLKMSFLSILLFLLRPLQIGVLDGWCIIATGIKY